MTRRILKFAIIATIVVGLFVLGLGMAGDAVVAFAKLH